jgi:hypothetical protein
MPGYSRSPLAFDDLRELFQLALDSEQGLKIVCKTRAEAFLTRSRMHYLRKMDKKDNATTYPPDHPMHGRSIWDKFVLRIPPKDKPDNATIFIERRSMNFLSIEAL